MDIGEFIDTYSDDLINIHEARAALRTHPLRRDYAFTEYVDASFCRMLAVFVIGSIEVMLKNWRDRDRVNVLDNYFRKDVNNGVRVTSLYEAFRGAGIQVDRQVFDDYLAMKYLRNTIVHGEWKEHEKEWLDRRGFPTDTRKLTKEHLDKIEHVNQNMMFYIFLTGYAEPNVAKPEKLIKLDETMTRRTDETGILRLRDIDCIIWQNLERIDALIYADIEKTVTSGRYAWTDGYSHADLEGLLARQNANDSSTSPRGVRERRTTNCLPSTALWRRKHRSSGLTTGSELSRLAAWMRNVSNAPFRCLAVRILTQK